MATPITPRKTSMALRSSLTRLGAIPQQAIAALAAKYTISTFRASGQTKDFGYNVGEEYTDGEEFFSNVPEGGSKEVLELVAEIKGATIAHEGFLYNEATGQYEYHNPEEAPMSMQLQ